MVDLDKIISEYEKENKITKQQMEVFKNSKSVFPFNKYEYFFSYLLSHNLISFDDYEKKRTLYIEENKYLPLFTLCPRTFGEKWGQEHIRSMVPELEKPSKKLDPKYEGQYDLWFKGIKIEVKGSRAVNRDLPGVEVVEKALDSHTDKPFHMNFQQIKANCCDVFVWFAVWKDKITYWVLKNEEVVKNKYYSKGQHRGNVGEGQLWIKETNIHEFDQYEVKGEDLLHAIIEKYEIPPYDYDVKRAVDLYLAYKHSYHL